MAEKKEEKFKPISPKDLKADQREKVQFVTTDWEENPVVKNHHGPWKEEIYWLEGLQYYFYNVASGRIEDLAPKVPREIKNVYNRILPMVRQLWGELRYPHNFYVEPNTTESDDIKAANLGTSALSYTNDNGDFRRKVHMAKYWAIVTGNVYWKEWWNKNLRVYVRKDGKPKLLKVGNVDYDYVPPFNIRTDAYALGREGWRYTIEGKMVPKVVVEDEFGLKRGTLPDERTEGKRTGIFERDRLQRPKEKEVLRLEYMEKGTDSKKKGRFMVTTGSGWLLYDNENPSPDAQIGHFQIPGLMPILNSQFYESAVKIAQPGQRQLNRFGSMVDEHIQNYRLKAIISGGSLAPGEFERFTRAGVDYVIVRPGMTVPYWQSPPVLPEIIIRWFGFHQDEIETETSVRKVSYGQLPKQAYRASGVLFEGLKRQDSIVLEPNIEDVDNALLAPMKFRLQLMQKHYDLPRLIKVTGKNKETSTIFLEGTELKDNTDVRVRGGVELFADKKFKQDVVMTFVEKGLIKDPDEAMDLLQVKGLEEYTEERLIDRRQAHRENEMIKKGDVDPKPSDDDNHQVHYEVHNNERKKEEFNTWPEKSKNKLLAMIEFHKDKMAESVKRIKEETQGPAEGMAPPGGLAAPTGEEISPEELLEQLAVGGI